MAVNGVKNNVNRGHSQVDSSVSPGKANRVIANNNTGDAKGSNGVPAKAFTSKPRPMAPNPTAAGNGLFVAKAPRTPAEYAMMIMHDPERLAADFIAATLPDKDGHTVLTNQFLNVG